ncbi:recombinase family protein [Tritonibacter mobilis]|uniref:Recombinase family protein n=1 Tax=Tritonibacter mobilis F1926 TaxID=1265309 RepID=A0A1B1A9T9_9RHOB|nr:recombinase family protein [Tritonibacter mobilis]ANP43319.1 hypothetical protein K529_021425 [Tritonibacter mobilis F1926]
MTIKAYSYLRISSDRQKQGGGIKRQMEASAKWAEDNGYELAETIADEGLSAFTGTHAKRGGFARFLAAVDSGAVARGSILIVESLDRLSREKVMDAFDQFRDIVKRGIHIVTLVDGQVYSEDSMNQNIGQLFMSLGVMLRSHDESATKSQRGKAAWQQKRAAAAESAKILTKNAPAWLELNEDRSGFLVKQPHGQTIQKIFDLSINGMGAYSITRFLNENIEKYPTMANGSSWNDAYVIRILKNPAVLGKLTLTEKIDGKRVPTGEVVDGYYPTIISTEDFSLVQAELRERKTGAAGRKGEHFANLFSGIAECGNCGGGMLHRNKGKEPRGYRFLRCSNSLKGNGCNCPAWRYDEFESQFINFVKDVSFAEVFSGKTADTQMVELRGRKAVELDKIAQAEQKYLALVEQFTDANLPEMLKESLIKKSVELENEIVAAKEAVETIDAELTKLSTSNVEADQSEFLESYEQLLSGDKDKLREVRFAMHSILRRNIDSISVNNGTYFEPWEEIPDSLRAELAGKGIISQNDIEGYLSKPHGKRLRDKHDRHFLVHFKNGVRRRVGAEYSLLDVSKSDLALIEKFESK